MSANMIAQWIQKHRLYQRLAWFFGIIALILLAIALGVQIFWLYFAAAIFGALWLIFYLQLNFLLNKEQDLLWQKCDAHAFYTIKKAFRKHSSHFQNNFDLALGAQYMGDFQSAVTYLATIDQAKIPLADKIRVNASLVYLAHQLGNQNLENFYSEKLYYFTHQVYDMEELAAAENAERFLYTEAALEKFTPQVYNILQEDLAQEQNPFSILTTQYQLALFYLRQGRFDLAQPACQFVGKYGQNTYYVQTLEKFYQ